MTHLVEFRVPDCTSWSIGFHFLCVPLIWVIVCLHLLWCEILSVSIEVFDSVILVGGVIVCYLSLIVLLIGEPFPDDGTNVIHLVGACGPVPVHPWRSDGLFHPWRCCSSFMFVGSRFLSTPFPHPWNCTLILGE